MYRGGPHAKIDTMTSSATVPYAQDRPSAGAYPVYARSQEGRVIAGVAAGLSAHLKVDVFYVRLAFFVGAFLSGVGLFAYAGIWLLSKSSPDVPAPAHRMNVPRWVNFSFVIVAVVGFFFTARVASGIPGQALIPLAIAGLGAFLAWQAYDRGINSGRSYVSIILGVGLMIAGIVLILSFLDEQGGGFVPAIMAVLLTLGGVLALGGPLLLRLWNNLAEERALKAASEERAEIASRLHDSVLQTLALIQKRSEDSEEVLRLARGQERELRQWLFEAEEKNSQSIFAAVETACGEVEDLFGIRIAPVTVGTDQAITDESQTVILAAREAMVNAAKHAGVDTLDVYAELLGGELSIFVRDRGAGFDPEDFPEDRHGIRESIYARMERVGGTAAIRSAAGEGTEVSLSLALPVS